MKRQCMRSHRHRVLADVASLTSIASDRLNVGHQGFLSTGTGRYMTVFFGSTGMMMNNDEAID